MTRDDLAAFALPPVILVPLALNSGGYFPPSWGWASLALLAVTLLSLTLREKLELGPADVFMVAALSGFAVLTLVSGIWTVDLTRTVLAGERAILYPIGMFAVVITVRRASVVALLGGLAATTSVIALVALGARYAPGMFGATASTLAHGQTYVPIGYWNGLGCVMAIGIVLLVGLALDLAGSIRAVLIACTVLEVWTLVLTQSRAATVAAVAGILVVLILRRGNTPSFRNVAVASVILCTLAASIAPAVAGQGDGQAETDAGLFSLTGRGTLWRVAWREFERHPILGSGAGTWNAFWSELRPQGHNVGNPHSLYLQALGELGIVGLLAIGIAIAAPLVVAVRRRDSPWMPVAAGAYVVFVIHTFVDWDWELTAVGMTGVWCGAAAVIAGRRPERVWQLRPSARMATGAVCVALALPVVIALVGNTLVARSVAAYADGNYAGSASEAHRAARWMPWSYEPWEWQGEAALAQHRPALALRWFTRARAKPDGSGVWRLWWNLARASSGNAQIPYLRRVVLLNPLSPEVRTLCKQMETGGRSPFNEFCRTRPRAKGNRSPAS